MQERNGALFSAGSNSWSLNLGPDMTLYAFDKSDNRLKTLRVTGFSAAGVPRYDLAALKTLPEAMSRGYLPNYGCALPSADNKSLLLNLAVSANPETFLWHCFDLQSGQLRWTYPNPYYQVHGSHKAPAPEPGLLRGAFGPVGTATVPGAGSFWVINGNLGEWWALSADGFYLSRVFNGNVFDWKWPELPTPGADFMNLPAGSGAEDFGGSLTQGTDGQVYIQAGKAGLWNLSLNGLEKTVALPGGAMTLNEADISRANAMREGALQAAVGVAQLTVPRATVAFSGDLDADICNQRARHFPENRRSLGQKRARLGRQKPLRRLAGQRRDAVDQRRDRYFADVCGG